MNFSEIKNGLDSCSTVEQIKSYKEQTLKKMDEEHTKKMNKLNEIKARHHEELDTLSEEIKKYITSKDFDKVSELIKKQAALITEQSIEMLSVI